MKIKLFALAFFFCVLLINAQDIDYENVQVEYVRLPLKPVSKTIKNYMVIVNLEYLSKIEQQKAAYQQQLKDADADYLKQQNEYNKKLQDAAVKFQADMLAWSLLTPPKQLDTPKPIMPIIPLPSKKTVEEEPYEKVFDKTVLADTKILLEGFNKVEDQPLVISLFLMGFENTVPVVKSKTVNKKVNEVSTPVTTFNYEMTYRHIIKSKVLSPTDGFIMDEIYNPTMTYVTYISKEFPTQLELENWWKINYKTELENLQTNIVNDNMSLYNTFLNNVYGYKKTTRNFSVSFMDEKSNYDDYKDALAQSKTGYTLIGNVGTASSGIEYIKKAIAIWEKAMLESNPKNKKARVDEDVTEATLYNLAEAYAWINEFPKALEYLNKLRGFKLSNKEKSMAAQTASFISDQQVRALSNK